MESKEKLTKKDYILTSIRAYLFQNAFNYSNYQGIGYANILYPALKKIYKNDEEKLKKAISANIEFYNINPQMVPFVTNLHLKMLENGTSPEDIKNIKASLMGPLSGIGDSLSQFLLAPIFSIVCATMALQGEIFGPILFILGLNLILLVIKIIAGNFAYVSGVEVIQSISEKTKKITYLSSMLCVTVISAIITRVFNVKLSFYNLQNKLDKAFPAILPILYIILIYYLLKKKKWNTYYLVIFTILVSIVVTYFNILV